MIARVYTSNAYIPLPDAPVSFFQTADGSLLALRYTNSSGLTEPISVATPDAAQSQSPGSALPPYSTVEIAVSYPGFRSAREEDVPIFPGVETVQDLQLQPLGTGAPLDAAIGPSQATQNL